MKKTLTIFSLIIGFVLAANLSATAQTRISFAKGTSEKTISVTVPANGEKSFVLAVNKNQAINVNLLTSQGFSVSVNLTNGVEGKDNWEDYEGGLTVLTGRKGDYVFSLNNNSKKSRTFKMKVRVGSADEYEGGISVDQE